MYLSKLIIKNFRAFDEKGIELDLQPGLNLLVGENNSSKTTIIDAIRLILQTRDNERLWLEKEDFHCKTKPKQDNGKQEVIHEHIDNLTIECEFKGFKNDEAAPFLEWIGFDKETKEYILKLKLVARMFENSPTKYGNRITVDVTAGPDDKGTRMDGLARDLLKATYLKPLRDAEQELKSKRGSRLSQILYSHPEIDITTPEGKKEKERIERAISLLNRCILKENSVYKKRENELNTNYFSKFLFEDQELLASICMANPDFREILEKLELNIDKNRPQGLGINNLLFMATELLLLKPCSGDHDLPLLLIEEPEAHIHPQYQLNLIKYFESQKDVQVIMTSHSPNLASSVDIMRLILVKDHKVFPMGPEYTCLEANDYEFLKRFLDVTKANLFFAKGIIMVEGDSEALLLPVLAELIDKPLHKHGVSILNVGHIGFFRYSRIFIRSNKNENMGIKVACVTDLDIPPDISSNFKDYLGNSHLKKSQKQLNKLEEESKKKLHSLGFHKLNKEEKDQQSKLDFSNIETFVSNQWTLEFDIANLGNHQSKLLHKAISLANHIETPKEIEAIFHNWVNKYKNNLNSQELLACQIFKPLYDKEVSKPETMQYFIREVTEYFNTERVSVDDRRLYFPKYLIDAIDHVTIKQKTVTEEGSSLIKEEQECQQQVVTC